MRRENQHHSKPLIIVVSIWIAASLFSGCGNSEENARTLLNQAHKLSREGKAGEAKELYNKIVSNYPQTEVARDANKILDDIYTKEARNLLVEAARFTRAGDLLLATQTVNRIISEYKQSEAVKPARELIEEIKVLKKVKVKSELDKVSAAQDYYHTKHGTYSNSIQELTESGGFELNKDIEVSITSGNEQKFVLEGRYTNDSDKSIIEGPDHGVARLSFFNVKGGFVQNSELGQLFVIKGIVTNNYSSKRKLILLKGRLLDSAGKTVAVMNAYAGNSLTDDQIKTMTTRQKNEAQKGEYYKTEVDPESSIPFTVIFGGLPTNLSEFTIEAIQSIPAK